MEPRAIAEALRELGGLLEALGEPAFRVRAYERAAQTVQFVAPDELAARIDERRLRELPHIGPSMEHKIEQLASKGTLPELDALRSRVPSGFRELVRVDGLGPKRVLALHAALGVETLDDLERAVAERRVRGVKGFSVAAEARLGDAIARARVRPPSRHLWLAAEREAARVGERLAAAGVERGVVAGDARRAREEVDELVVVAVGDADAPARIAEHWSGARAEPGRVVATGADGLPIEVRLVPEDARGAALIVATGPSDHVALLAARARTRGLALGADGLVDADGRRVPGDEARVYAALDLAWIPPELRDDPDALRLGPDEVDELVRAEDLRGMVHCHTTWSDGREDIEAMARACAAMGFAYLTITDHSSASAYAGGLDEDQLRRQWDAIDAAQEQVDIALLKGTEADILADGALDWPDRVLERLDVVIASVHQRHKLDRAGATRRLVRAMELPWFKIWGHGLGRLVGRRAPVDCDVEQVLDALVGRGAVEINADPHRLDLPPEWLARAAARGLPFVISSDAHSVAGLSVLPFGVGLARRAGIRRDQVLNTLPAAAFRGRVAPRG